MAASGTLNLLLDGNSDWPKEVLDFLTVDGTRPVENADELRATLEMMGESVEHFKSLPGYKFAVGSGRYLWLKNL